MTDRPMKMTADQFDALTEMIRAEAHEISRRNSGMILFPQDREMTGSAWDRARRLLVDDESPKADPDLTTFGELKTGQWFQVVATGCRLVKPPQHVLAMGGMDAIDLRGCPHIMPNGTPVRRLPKPEFPK